MRIICDTHIPLFWANAPSRLSTSAAAALEKGRLQGQLAIADISLWELALLIDRGLLQLPGDVSPVDHLSRLLQALRLQVLPITADIAVSRITGEGAFRQCSSNRFAIVWQKASETSTASKA